MKRYTEHLSGGVQERKDGELVSYADAQAALAAKDADIAEMKAAIEKQKRAANFLNDAQGRELILLRERDAKAQTAILTLESEKQMNAELTAENQRLREALKQAHVEVTKAQLGEEYEPDVDVLSMLERFTGWNGSTYEQALAQTELHNPSDPTTVDLGSGKVFIGTGYQGSNAIIWFRPTGVEQEIGSIDPDFKEGEQHFNATDIIVSISNIESTQVLREALDYCMEVLAQTAQGGKEE